MEGSSPLIKFREKVHTKNFCCCNKTLFATYHLIVYLIGYG